MTNNLRLEHVSVTLSSAQPKSLPKKDDFQLGPIDLHIHAGEMCVVLGSSGSGKSTLLRTIAGLDKLNSGKIYVNNLEITHRAPEKRGMGMVFQQPLLFPHLSVEDNVAFGLKMHHIDKKQRLTRVAELLSLVELNNYGNRMPDELSGGQQQRVALARTLALQPPILLLDEPFSALDPLLREEMGKLLLRLHRQFLLTIVFVTHDQNEAFRLAQRIAIMKAGTIAQIATPKELYERPINAEIARFLGITNMWQGFVQDDLFSMGQFRLQIDHRSNLFSKHSVIAMLRPESLHVEESGVPTNNPTLTGLIQEVHYRQGFVYLQVEVNSVIVNVVEKVVSNLTPQVGDTVVLSYNRESVRLYPAQL